MKRLTDNQYAKVLFTLTSECQPKEIPNAVASFLSFVKKQQAQKRLPYVLALYQKLVDRQSGIMELEMTSARALSATTQNNVKAVFGGKVLMKTLEDPDLIGGVIVKTENKIFDGSIRTQLKKLKQHLT